MVLGDIQDWESQFVSLDERIIERIAVVWPMCVSILPPQPLEDTITINLVDLLSNDKVVRRICHWVEFQFEPFDINKKGIKHSKGKIDIAILPYWNRDRYLAYECKRLNVSHGGKRSSLATAYVADGMMRFIKRQYSEGLPVGCMLGYVIDGDIPFAKNKVTTAISSDVELCVLAGPEKMKPVDNFERFSTTHRKLNNDEIVLRHVLLPFLEDNSTGK